MKKKERKEREKQLSTCSILIAISLSQICIARGEEVDASMFKEHERRRCGNIELEDPHFVSVRTYVYIYTYGALLNRGSILTTFSGCAQTCYFHLAFDIEFASCAAEEQKKIRPVSPCRNTSNQIVFECNESRRSAQGTKGDVRFSRGALRFLLFLSSVTL